MRGGSLFSEAETPPPHRRYIASHGEWVKGGIETCLTLHGGHGTFEREFRPGFDDLYRTAHRGHRPIELNNTRLGVSSPMPVLKG